MRLRDATATGTTISLAAGGSAVFFPVPTGHSPSELARYAVPLTGTSASYAVGHRTVSTTIAYLTGDGSPTAYGALPHQKSAITGPACHLGVFPTVYGGLRLCHGTALTWSVPRVTASRQLDLSGLDASQRVELAHQALADLDATPTAPTDSYYGGKWLYRLAQLGQLASQVGAEDVAKAAFDRLAGQLKRWTQPTGCQTRPDTCFVYDPIWRGIVGEAPSFGSELFNDHHFHYGYFLYAAAVLAHHDPRAAARLEPVMSLLMADIASPTNTGLMPKWRVFDPWAGHSWASGVADFADGNDQESTSEAVNAWAGMDLWAAATGDRTLRRQAIWMMSAEANSALTYSVAPGLSTPVYSGFIKQSLGISWGGKRDYATWFSPEPQAVLGIQLIPMSPSSGYLASHANRIDASVADATASGGFDEPLGDYILMYSALTGPHAAKQALPIARALPDSAIDDGDSRSYLLAFLMSHE